MSSTLDTVLEDILAVQENYSRGMVEDGASLILSLVDVKADRD